MAIISTFVVLGSMMLIGCSPLSLSNGEESADTDQSLTSPSSSSEPSITSNVEQDEPPGGILHQTTTGDSMSVERDELSIDDDVLTGESEIGQIIFAQGITESYDPIDPAFVFSQDITEVHAIFEYRGLSPEDAWERVWYLNEQEVARSSSRWTGPEHGVFDYFVDNGGEPLPPGDWILELYVNGKLRSLGVFIIGEN